MEPSGPASSDSRRRWTLTCLVLLVALLLPGLSRLETDNSPQIFFVEDSESVRAYENYRELFGSDVGLRILLEGPRLWSRESLAWKGDLELRLGEIPGVLQVSGLSSHYRRFGWPPKDPDDLRRRAAANTLDRGAGWISRDGGMLTLLVQTEPLRSRENALLLDAVETLLAEPPDGVMARVLGLPVLNRELDESSREIDRVFFPLLLLFAVALLGWVLRRAKYLVAPLIFVGLCELTVMAAMGYAGVRLNMVLAILPPLILAISLAGAVHVLLYLRRKPHDDGRSVEDRSAEDRSAEDGSAEDRSAEDGTDERGDEGPTRELSRAERVERVFQDKGWAILWTGITTSIGFASLATSPLSPVRSLGLWAAFGLGLTTLWAFVFFPPLLSTFGFGTAGAVSSWESRWARRGEKLGRWAHRRRKPILWAAALCSGILLLGIPQVRTMSNALHYLAADHPLRSGIERLEKHGIGVATVELTLSLPRNTGGGPAAFSSAGTVDRLADLGTSLERLDGIYGVISAGSVLRDALQWVPTTPTNAHMRQQMALEGLLGDADGRRILDSLLTPDRLTAHATIFVETADVERLDRLTARIVEASAIEFPEAEIRTTGQYPLLLDAQKYLISTLVTSLGATLLAVALVLRFLLPSFRLAFLALLPNLWPLIGVFGYMGWAGIPLDIASVMTASVVLGLAVDDSIHTLGHFRRLAPVVGSRVAVEKTLFATAPAYVLTATILIAGFGVCAFSSFAPVAGFGSLSAMAIGMALIGDLFLLPALLSLTPTEVTRRLA